MVAVAIVEGRRRARTRSSGAGRACHIRA
jgi:hypothetical protein